MKCDVCGAPVENGVCTYCGKKFPMPPNNQRPVQNVEGVSSPILQNGGYNNFPQVPGPSKAPNPMPPRPPIQPYKPSVPTWLCILMLILFFPIGIALMWKYKKFHPIVRIIITVIFAIATISVIGQNRDSDSQGSKDSSPTSIQSQIDSSQAG